MPLICTTVADTVFKYVFLQIISFLPFPPSQTNSPELGLESVRLVWISKYCQVM